jgi:uncharacterized HhH-GPD family protein
MARPSLHLSQDAQADALLSRDPLALLVGMVLDQQIPLEWAFAGPAELKRRLGGTFAVPQIASMPEDELAEHFAARPALHRYPRAMAARVQALCTLLVERYGGKAERVWLGVDDAGELLARLRGLPGFGEQKAKIFMALLGKQLGVRPQGWEAACAPFGEPGSTRSVADIVDPESLEHVRAWKQAAKRAAKQTADKAKPAAKVPAKRAAKVPAKRAAKTR